MFLIISTVFVVLLVLGFSITMGWFFRGGD